MTTIVPALAALHLALALAFGAVTVALVITALAGSALVPTRLLADRLVLVSIVVSGVAAIVGLALLALRGPPSDALHLLYGAVAVAALPALRYAARNVQPRRLSILLALAGVALLGVLFRLWTTG